MHTIQVVFEIFNFLKKNLNLPDDDFDTEVASSRRNTCQLTMADSSSDNYMNGIMRVMSGDYAGLFMPVLSSIGTQVDTFTFFRDVVPAVGDEIKLTGEPLSRAIVYPIKSKSYEDLDSDVWITIVPSDQLVGFKGAAGDRANQQRRNQQRTSDITLLLAIKEKTTFETALDQLWSSMEIFALSEQVIQLLHNYRGKEESGIAGIGDIRAEPGFMDVEGQQEIAVIAIEFSVQIT